MHKSLVILLALFFVCGLNSSLSLLNTTATVQATTGVSFDVCLQDEGNDNIFELNSTTGNYKFTKCSTGFTLYGRGVIRGRGNISTLQQGDTENDRRVVASVDNGAKKGTANVQIFSLGRTFTIIDKDLTTNICSCSGIPDLLIGAVFPPNILPAITTLPYVTEDGIQLDMEVIKGRVVLLFAPTVVPLRAENAILSNGGNIVGKIPTIGFYIVDVLSSTEMNFINKMRQEAGVIYVSPDLPLKPQTFNPNEWETNRILRRNAWYLNKINAPLAWGLASTSNLSPIEIGIIDHSFKDFDLALGDFEGRLQGAIPSAIENSEPTHGTAVTALCCATGNNGFGNVGVNWWSKLRLSKAGNVAGAVIELVKTAGAGSNVVNISLGYGDGNGSCSSVEGIGGAVVFRTLFTAVNNINDFIVLFKPNHKFLVTIAAGNENCDLSNILSNKPVNVLLVGASNISDQKTSYSNFGTLVDIAAPGGDSTEFLSWVSYGTNQVEFTLDENAFEGTSFASPLVAGAAALLLAKESNLSAMQVVQRLKDTARRPVNYPNNFGAGILNVYKALEPSSSIVVDGDLNDWTGITPLLTDPVGDGPFDSLGQYQAGMDIRNIYVTNDGQRVYFLIETAGNSFNVDGFIGLFLDTDLDSNTGCTAFLGSEGFVSFNPEVITLHGPIAALSEFRNCGTGVGDFQERLCFATRGSFIELSVSIGSLRILSSNTMSFRVWAEGIVAGGVDFVLPPAQYLLH